MPIPALRPFGATPLLALPQTLLQAEGRSPPPAGRPAEAHRTLTPPADTPVRLPGVPSRPEAPARPRRGLPALPGSVPRRGPAPQLLLRGARRALRPRPPFETLGHFRRRSVPYPRAAPWARALWFGGPAGSCSGPSSRCSRGPAEDLARLLAGQEARVRRDPEQTPQLCPRSLLESSLFLFLARGEGGGGSAPSPPPRGRVAATAMEGNAFFVCIAPGTWRVASATSA